LPGAPGYQVPTEVPEEYIPKLVEQFRTAGVNAKKAGFDGVERGYFPSQNREPECFTDGWISSRRKRILDSPIP
jgi:hypothetical protein